MSKEKAGMHDRTQIINFKVSPYEKELIEKHAKKEGDSVAKFVRMCVFMTMALDGNLEVMKYMMGRFASEMKSTFKKRFMNSDTEEVTTN